MTTLPPRHHQVKRQVIEDNLDYLVRFAFFRIGERGLAEDVVHDAVVRFLDRCPSSLSPSKMRLYLFRILHNLCNDESRRGRVRSVPLEEVGPGDEVDDEDALDAEEAMRLNRLLDGLPEKEREAVRLHVIDGFSFVEAAEMLSVAASTLKTRYKAGMDKLRNRYFSN